MVSSVICLQETVPFEADERQRLMIPEGLLGFEEYTDYLLFGSKELCPFRVLQALDEMTTIFLVVEPHFFFSDYRLELCEADKRLLELADPAEALVLALLVVPEDPLETTANLLAPLVVNPTNGLCRQVVLRDSPYTVRELVFAKSSASQSP
ncbi:MAG: flagellar assembly protein FliW [Chloroflexota bacterium]